MGRLDGLGYICGRLLISVYVLVFRSLLFFFYRGSRLYLGYCVGLYRGYRGSGIGVGFGLSVVGGNL